MGAEDLNFRKTKQGNFFFTDYRMIHNIPNDILIEDCKLKDIFKDDYLNFRYESDRKKEDSLFELVQMTSNLKN